MAEQKEKNKGATDMEPLGGGCIRYSVTFSAVKVPNPMPTSRNERIKERIGTPFASQRRTCPMTLPSR